jgi:hypothetical protein
VKCLKLPWNRARIAQERSAGDSSNYVNLPYSFAFNECRLSALLVASLRLLDRITTWAGTHSISLAKISSRFPSRPCGITWSIPMIMQPLPQLREGYFEKWLPVVNRLVRTNDFWLHVTFIRPNNGKRSTYISTTYFSNIF